MQESNGRKTKTHTIGRTTTLKLAGFQVCNGSNLRCCAFSGDLRCTNMTCWLSLEDNIRKRYSSLNITLWPYGGHAFYSSCKVVKQCIVQTITPETQTEIAARYSAWSASFNTQPFGLDSLVIASGGTKALTVRGWTTFRTTRRLALTQSSRRRRGPHRLSFFHRKLCPVLQLIAESWLEWGWRFGLRILLNGEMEGGREGQGRVREMVAH